MGRESRTLWAGQRRRSVPGTADPRGTAAVHMLHLHTVAGLHSPAGHTHAIHFKTHSQDKGNWYDMKPSKCPKTEGGVKHEEALQETKARICPQAPTMKWLRQIWNKQYVVILGCTKRKRS